MSAQKCSCACTHILDKRASLSTIAPWQHAYCGVNDLYKRHRKTLVHPPLSSPSRTPQSAHSWYGMTVDDVRLLFLPAGELRRRLAEFRAEV